MVSGNIHLVDLCSLSRWGLGVTLNPSIFPKDLSHKVNLLSCKFRNQANPELRSGVPKGHYTGNTFSGGWHNSIWLENILTGVTTKISSCTILSGTSELLDRVLGASKVWRCELVFRRAIKLVTERQTTVFVVSSWDRNGGRIIMFINPFAYRIYSAAVLKNIMEMGSWVISVVSAILLRRYSP